MSYPSNAEARIEAALKSGFQTAIADTNSATPDSVDVAYRCFWLNDASDTGEPSTTREKTRFPQVMIACSPVSTPGFQQPDRVADVTINVATAVAFDPLRSVMAAIYADIRGALEESSFADSSMANCAVMIPDPGTVYVDSFVSVVEFTAQANVWFTAET